MRMMPKTNLNSLSKQTEQHEHCSRPTRQQLTSRRKKRKLSCSSMEEFVAYKSRKRQKLHDDDNHYFHRTLCRTFTYNSVSESNDRFVIEDKVIWNDAKGTGSKSRKNSKEDLHQSTEYCVPLSRTLPNPESKRWINDLPQEILLKIFSYLPLEMLLHIIPQVCKKWEVLAMDWTLWKTVEDLTIKNMVISTAKLKSLLRTIPRLRKLELFSRNDTEELLHEVFNTHRNLEALKLDCCCRSTLQMNMLSQTVTYILEFCPKLKTIILTDTYFHSKHFYRCLAKKFRSIERVNVTCTTKSEMDVFMENLKDTVSEVHFQKVPMMGRAAGKQIYWGPILGLVVRPIPTSPFHQHCMHENFPNYAF